jgi:transposase-like protein
MLFQTILKSVSRLWRSVESSTQPSTEPEIEIPISNAAMPCTATELDTQATCLFHLQQHLNKPESHETLRQERWHISVHCPACQAIHIQRLLAVDLSPYRYQCLACGEYFNDNTGTPFEEGVPPIHIWMQCWYLMGSTTSLTVIAKKLNLNLSTIERMCQELQKIFHTAQPLTHFMEFTEWSAQSPQIRVQLQENLLKTFERLGMDLASLPADTAEYRKQQQLRRSAPPPH